MDPLFDETIQGEALLPPSRPANLAELILEDRPEEDDSRPILLGTQGDAPLSVSLRGLRHAVIHICRRFPAFGLRRGDTVCLIRLPRTSEALAGVLYAALTSAGLRVLFPMYVEPSSLMGWLHATNAKAVLWAAQELRGGAGNDADLNLLARLSRTLQRDGIPAICFETDLELSKLLSAGPRPSSGRDQRSTADLDTSAPADAECLVLTTSGTSGFAKLVGYSQRAFLRSCASWEQASLFSPEKLGGRGLCLLLAHSMGVRAFWNAVWTRQAICLIPPEWFLEHPERVRHLLMEMRPEHITGGPGVFRTLLELGRVFPDLKTACFASLRCVVSSGADFDPALSRRIEVAFGLRLHNAFGMTETMQVTSSLVEGPLASPSGALGNPLPGVTIGLKRRTDLGTSIFDLHVRSSFASSGYVLQDDQTQNGDPGEWLDTGDLVKRSEGGLLYHGRAREGVTKDAFGVKIAADLLAKRFAALDEDISHLELFRLREEPGLGAFVFLETWRRHPAPDGLLVSDPFVLDRVASHIAARQARLRTELDDFELRHLTIGRFICVWGAPPRTAKGNASRSQIELRFARSLKELTGPYVARPYIRRVERESFLQPDFTLFASPRRGELLRAARLDKCFASGLGDRLQFSDHGQSREVIDFVGGFGVNLLGHRHPDILEAIREFAASPHVFISDQGSRRQSEGELARRLAEAVSRHTGRAYVVRLGSTGAEAVEMALAHAFLERYERIRKFVREQRRLSAISRRARAAEIEAELISALEAHPPKVLAIEKGFHGVSLGARSLLAGEHGRHVYAPMTRIEPIFLPAGGGVDVDRLVEAERIRCPALEVRDGGVVEGERSFSGVIAAIAEPILGEGGVTEVSGDLLRRLGAFDFPLILDEIQCGLGRSGSFLASAGVPGDYYLFGKALGGGVAKVSAVAIDRERYVPRFDEDYGATFSGDPFSCSLAVRTLEIVERDRIAERAYERGARLQRVLDGVQRKFPDVIRRVAGRGLMWGVELSDAGAQDCLTLRMLHTHDMLGVVASSFLLNRCGVRLLPTLSAPSVLRIEPSAYVTNEEIEALGTALDRLCTTLRERSTDHLLGVLVEEEVRFAEGARARSRTYPRFAGQVEEPTPGATRVAFLSNFVFPEEELALVDPALRRMPLVARRALFHKIVRLLELKPVIAFARNLWGGRLWFVFILLPVDAATLEQMHLADDRALAVERVQDGVELAHRYGCAVAALGAHTSIVTHDGTAILPPAGMRITTGNSLTVAAGVRRVFEACRRHRIDPGARSTRLAIVGATGNIGTGLAHQIVDHPGSFCHLTLVARNPSRLAHLAKSLQAHSSLGPELDLIVATDVAAVRECNVILAAASTNETLIFPHHVDRARPVIVADASLPPVVSAEVLSLPSVRVVPLFVRVPGDPNFTMASHIRSGKAFCCAAELMLLGLEPEATGGLPLTGPIEPEAVRVLDHLAERHGFFARGLSVTVDGDDAA